MKALIKSKPERGLWLEEAPEPGLNPNEVRIRILKSAICGTDLHIHNWDAWAEKTVKTPQIIGHEFVGRVEEIGDQVKDVTCGDLVSAEGHVVCGHCRNCLAGRRHLCNSCSGIGVHRSGAFAEYISVPVSNIWHCDPTIDLKTLACFDPLGNATHTALSFDLLGEDVLITGAGPIGLMATAIARHAGARFIAITDINEQRLEMAKSLGANLAINVTKDSLEDAQKKLNMKEGFDIGMEMSGNPQALNQMIGNMAHGGKIAMLGIQPSETTINWDKIIFSGITIKGIYGREMFETWYKMTSMIQTGLDISPLITHEMDYRDYRDGFELMNQGECGKVVLDWAS